MRAKIILLMWIYERRRRRRVVARVDMYDYESNFLYQLPSFYYLFDFSSSLLLATCNKNKIILRLFFKKKKIEPQSDFYFIFHYEFLHAIIVSPAHFEINMRHPIVLNKFFSFFPSPYIHFRYICGCILLHMCDVSCKFHILNFFDILNW